MRFTTDPRLSSVLAALCFAAPAGIFAAAPAAAEWYADLYAGVAYTPRSDVTLVVSLPSGSADHTFHDVKWNDSATYGGRAGYWFDGTPWLGIGLDVFRFDADIPTQSVSTTILGVTAPATLQAIDVSNKVVALDVLLRYPLFVSPAYPKGRLQPYVTAGPAYFKTRAKNTTNGELTTQAATDSSTGYKLGGGLSWQVVKDVAIFGELRYTHVRAAPVLSSALSPLKVPLQFDLNTYHLVAGVSFRF